MPKKSDKLVKALEALGLEYADDMKYIVIYGKMAEAGYLWNGENWIRDSDIALDSPASLRIVAGSYEDCEELLSSIVSFLREAGVLIVRQSRIVPNDNGGGYRVYLDMK